MATNEEGRKAHEEGSGSGKMEGAVESGRRAMEGGARAMYAGGRALDPQMEATMKVGDVSMEFYHDAMAFGRGNVDAFVKANMMMAQGYQEIFKAMIGMAKEAMEDGMGRQAIDRMANRGSQISEMYMAMLEHAMEPINERFAAAADTLKQGTEHQQRLGRNGERQQPRMGQEGERERQQPRLGGQQEGGERH